MCAGRSAQRVALPLNAAPLRLARSALQSRSVSPLAPMPAALGRGARSAHRMTLHAAAATEEKTAEETFAYQAEVRCCPSQICIRSGRKDLDYTCADG